VWKSLRAFVCDIAMCAECDFVLWTLGCGELCDNSVSECPQNAVGTVTDALPGWVDASKGCVPRIRGVNRRNIVDINRFASLSD
jgi:hypothetical protein